MGLRQPELGDRQRFEVRRGVGGFSMWGGVNRETDPSCIDPWEFHHLVNVSYDFESIAARGGQERLGSDTAMASCVTGIIDLGSDAAGGTNLLAASSQDSSLFIINDENTTVQGDTSLTGPDIFVDVEQSTIVTRRRRVFHPYQGGLLVHTRVSPTESLARVNVKSVAGVAVLEYAKVVDLVTIANNAAEYQDKLWLADTSLGTGSVYTWDGTSLVRDVTALGAGDLLIFAFQETVLVFGTHFCKKRTSAGTWTSVAMPGGLTSFRAIDACVYNNVLYVGGRDDITSLPTILTYDGTTLATAHQIAWTGIDSALDREGVCAVCVFNGLLYFGYGGKRGTNDFCAPIGTYDGSTWTDVHYDFGDLLSGRFSRAIRALTVHRGNLRVGVGKYSSAPNQGVAKSAGTNTQSWTYEDSASRDTMDLVVF